MQSKSPLNAPLVFAIVLLGVASSAVAIAASRQHGAHVHGEAILDIAIEGGRVDLHLDAPGASITGFEHPPTDASEKTLYDGAVMLLRNPLQWLKPTISAGCTAKPAVVDAHGFDIGLAKLQSAHTGGNAPTEVHEHSDFDVDASFTCVHPAKLTGIDVALFARFPPLHKVIVNLALASGQNRQELVPSAATIHLGH